MKFPSEPKIYLLAKWTNLGSRNEKPSTFGRGL